MHSSPPWDGPKWKPQSSLYKDWLLREVLQQDDDSIRKGRAWSLYPLDGFYPEDEDEARNKRQRVDEMC